MSQDLCSLLQCNVCLVLQAHHDDYQKSSPTSEFSKALGICNGCNLLRYCGKAHQKLDWPLHREFCAAIQKIKKAARAKHPFLLSRIPKGRDDVENAILQLKYLLKQKLGRPLQYHEEELTSYPAYCGRCYSLEHVNHICPDCKNQAYCSQEHLKLHVVKHQQICGLLSLYYTPFKTISKNTERELTLKQRVNDMLKTDLVETFEKTFNTKLPENPTSSLENYQLFSYAADFSCITSICFALSLLHMTQQEDDTFVIYIIGASIESVLWFRDIHCRFFFQQYPHVNHLELHFIGPEVAEPLKDIVQFEFLNSERTIHYHCYRGLFQTYRQYIKVSPSIIVVFNCGFSEYSQHYNCAPQLSNLNTLESVATKDNCTISAKDTWYQGLEKILLTSDIPFIFTSFTKQEAEFDFAALQKVALCQPLKVRIERMFKVSKNPFHDLRPLRQWYTRDHESFYYRNGYIQAIKTKLMT